MSDEPEDQTRAAARQFAIRAGIAKLADIVNEYHSAKAEEERGNIIVAHARTRMATAIERHKQLIVMAQLFEFDLDREYSAYWDRQFELPQTDDKAVGRSATEMNVATLAETDRPKTIKEHAIAAAQHAYPNPIRATALRRQLEVTGIAVHEKTIGMTLYRLSKDGVLRRDGWDWFFVPEEQRQHAAAAQGEEGPGGDPGLFAAVE